MQSIEYKVSITPAEWAEMLQAAGAPESSWADPDAPQKLAAAITLREPDPDHTRTVWDRALEAVDELRRVLPEIIRSYEQGLQNIADRGWSERRVADIVRSDLAATRGLNEALPERRVFGLPPRLGRPWHIDAIRLLRLYWRYVNPKSGISANGPVVKFIEVVLRRMGHGRAIGALISPRGTIERYLNRQFRARQRRHD